MRRRPCDRRDQVDNGEADHRHAENAGHKRHHGAHAGGEAGDQNRLAAVPGEERFAFCDQFRPFAQQRDVRRPLPVMMAQPVGKPVSGDGARRRRQQQRPERQGAARHQRAEGDDDRSAGHRRPQHRQRLGGGRQQRQRIGENGMGGGGRHDRGNDRCHRGPPIPPGCCGAAGICRADGAGGNALPPAGRRSPVLRRALRRRTLGGHKLLFAASASNDTPSPPRAVSVVGAGIVGMCCALFLQRDGHQVTIIDPREPGAGASFGNAGIIATCQVWPIAMPGVLRRIPLMLLDPEGPVVLRWRYLPRIAPWLIRLIAAARPQRVERPAAALAALLAGAMPAYDALLAEVGAGDLVRRPGWLKVYASARAFAATAPERELLRRHGVRFEVLTAAQIRQLEPALAPLFGHGLFFPDCGLVLNPKRLVDTLARAFVAGGGRLLRERATGFAIDGDKAVLTEHSRHPCEAIVLAAGAWSRPLAARLGARVPLDTERGYHLMFETPEPSLGRPAQWGEHYFNLVPMEHGLRLTSGVEFARLARIMLPSLSSEPRSRWLGFRPSLPDSLPVLGRSARHADVYFAFGHQHLGLTLAAVSGRIIADLVAGRDPGLDLSPYRAERW